MQIILIAAMAENRTIGCGNTIPWKIKGEQKIFKDYTINHTVIMGRKTFESIGRALPNRKNIVISRQKKYVAQDCIIAHNISEALSMCNDNELVFIIGGENVYKQCMPLADKIYLTVIEREISGDAFFPSISSAEFDLQSVQQLHLSEPAKFYTYIRSKK